MTCTVSSCRLIPLWDLLFKGHSKRVGYCEEHARPHLRNPDVHARRLR